MDTSHTWQHRKHQNTVSNSVRDQIWNIVLRFMKLHSYAAEQEMDGCNGEADLWPVVYKMPSSLWHFCEILS